MGVFVIFLLHPAVNAVETLKYEFTPLSDDGEYSYSYELSDGSYKSEEAFHLNGVLIVSGEYGYKDATGKWYRVTYTSDSNGFRASGDHIPDTGTGTDDEPPDVQITLGNPAIIGASLAGR